MTLRDLTLGFMPLNDAAPLVVAHELGFFKKEGLNVTLSKQNSWATLRDKLAAGLLDGAHMLAPMPLASTLGVDGIKVNMLAPMVLSRGGNGITLSKQLAKQIPLNNDGDLPLPATRISDIATARKNAGTKLRFATVHPFSCHHYQLRQWLTQGGITLDDIDIIFLPPSSMVAALYSGDIDGFCVGSPWNTKAIREKVGVTVLTSADNWPGALEKVIAVTADFAKGNADVVTALIRALYKACLWLASPQNKLEAARFLTKAKYLDLSLDVIAPPLLDSCLSGLDKSPRQVQAFCQFDQGNQADVKEFQQLLAMMKQYQQVDIDQSSDVLAQVYSDALYLKALHQSS
ncbi:CmpA/NrtA family ABC transporter substrate-binding protein [Thalassotalea agarivorans]|uniref:Nitrate/nitrite transport system substrate-binding protein n=1 Tax=Thalassotalea agarivorans TaxID=349064 RepID=A0A1I0CU46_THASX|nr:CmpA/NrtA family ABC transporter substrate-binding protein [Thalassotalea agarivorans]SET23220.1 nitrate/nitrite transport system substrate-binding protein [Thalassotalea agarivorans]